MWNSGGGDHRRSFGTAEGVCLLGKTGNQTVPVWVATSQVACVTGNHIEIAGSRDVIGEPSCRQVAFTIT